MPSCEHAFFLDQGVNPSQLSKTKVSVTENLIYNLNVPTGTQSVVVNILPGVVLPGQKGRQNKHYLSPYALQELAKANTAKSVCEKQLDSQTVKLHQKESALDSAEKDLGSLKKKYVLEAKDNKANKAEIAKKKDLLDRQEKLVADLRAELEKERNIENDLRVKYRDAANLAKVKALEAANEHKKNEKLEKALATEEEKEQKILKDLHDAGVEAKVKEEQHKQELDANRVEMAKTGAALRVAFNQLQGLETSYDKAVKEGRLTEEELKKFKEMLEDQSALVKKLQDQVKKDKIKEDKMEKDLETAKKDAKEKQASIEKFSKELAEAKARGLYLKRRLGTLAQTNAANEKKLDDSKKELAMKNNKLSEALDKLASEHAKYQKSVAEGKVTAQDLGVVRENLKKQGDLVVLLKKQLEEEDLKEQGLRKELNDERAVEDKLRSKLQEEVDVEKALRARLQHELDEEKYLRGKLKEEEDLAGRLEKLVAARNLELGDVKGKLALEAELKEKMKKDLDAELEVEKGLRKTVAVEHAKVQKAQKDIEKQDKVIARTNEDLAGAIDKLGKMQLQYEDEVKHGKLAESELAKMKKMLQDQAAVVEKIQAALKAEHTKVVDLNKKYEGAAKEALQKTKENDDLKKKIAAMEAALKTSQSKLSSAEQLSAKRKEDLQKEVAKLNELEGKYQASVRDGKLTKEELKNKETALKKQSLLVKKCNGLLTQSAADIAALRAALKKEHAQHEQVQLQLKKEKELEAELKKKLEEEMKEEEFLRESLQKTTEIENALRKQLAKEKKECFKKNGVISARDKRIKELEAMLMDATKTQDVLKGKYKDMLKKHAQNDEEHASKSGALDKELEALRGKLQTETAAEAELLKQLEAMKGKFAEKVKSCENCHHEMDELKAINLKQSKKIDEQNRELADLRDKDSENVLTIGKKDGEIDALKGQLKQMKFDFDQAANEVKLEKERTASVRDEMNTNKKRAGDKIAFLEDQIRSLQKSLGDLKGDSAIREKIKDDAKSMFLTLRARVGCRIKDGRKEKAGVLVDMVYPDSPAEFYGILVHDYIETFDGEPVESNKVIMGLLKKKHPGDNVSMQVNREGVLMNIQLTVGVKMSGNTHLTNEQVATIRRQMTGVVTEEDVKYYTAHKQCEWATQVV